SPRRLGPPAPVPAASQPTAPAPRSRSPATGVPPPARVAQPDQRPPTEVGDQEADLAGADRFGQRGGQYIDRRDRRSRLDRRQQRTQVQRRSTTLTHRLT